MTFARGWRIMMVRRSRRIHLHGAGDASACLSLILVVFLCLFCVARPVRADVTWSGDVVPADPTTWDDRTEGYIGKIGTGTMNITDGSVVLDSYGYIGYETGSTGEVTVDGEGSIWENFIRLYVGDEGSGTLNIIGGGSVADGEEGLIIGYKSGSTGIVNISGIGSTLSCHGLSVGINGRGTLNITSGGAVSLIYDCFIGSISGSTGEVTVDGEGSTWINSGDLLVGREGNGTLNITNGGTVSNYFGSVGRYSGSMGEVTVDGIGSTWSNNSLFIGTNGSGTLNITGGGEVTAEWDTLVSHYSGSSGSIHFDNGTLTTGGILCSFDDLTGTGTIHTHGLSSDVDLVFDATHGLNQTFNINGNPDQNITLNLTVDGSGLMGAGHSGVGTMSISDGRVIESTDGYIGCKSGSTGEVTVEGAGSTWTNSRFLFVGNEGSGTMNITNSGAVSNSYNGYIGRYSGSTGEVTVNGIESTWMSNGLFVGYYGNGTLNITGGGAVSSSGFIGNYSSSTGEVTVDGAGSKWTNGEIYVGYKGCGTMNITNGGAVSSSGWGYIGSASGSKGEVTVDGIGSTWDNSELYIGSGMLDIINGGAVSSGWGYIGSVSGSTGAVTVSGDGSTWANNEDLSIGRYNGSGTLTITNGGAVSNSTGYIGYHNSGTTTVDGTDSTWTNSSGLYVGNFGIGALNIMCCGTVSNSTGYIGFRSGSTGVVMVDGPGSMWINRSDLYVGYVGNGTLNITDGGLVSIAGTLTIDYNLNGDGFINMATGGMLALYGDADDSLFDFLGLADGTDAIRYWDDSISDWNNITGATYGQDYMLSYLTEGDLAGYTMLTVPEPATLSLFALGTVAMLRRKRLASVA